jgi:hypothetical protein
MTSYNTFPKSWSGWTDLCSDINWEDIHGMWGKKGPDLAWYIIKFTNMVDACGERACKEMGVRYEAQVLRVDWRAVPIEERKQALNCIGNDSDPLEVKSEEELVYALVSYGLASPMAEFSAWNYPARVRKQAYLEAESLMKDYDRREELLDRPVNRIGTTAREFGSGDIMAGLRRHQENPPTEAEPTMELMSRLSGPQAPIVKQVRQADLTGECWMVQIYGTSYCSTCKYKDTTDCGGKDIRVTGTNSKGKTIGRTGL